MRTKRLGIRSISFLLAFTMVVSDVLYAAPADGFVPALSPKELLLQDAHRFEAPLDFSLLKDVRRGDGKTFIIHIQDAHSNLSGQQNLAGALDELMKRYDVSLVLVEGGTRDDSLTPLKKLAKPDVWKRVANRFLTEGKISGEEYLNLTSEHPMKIMGIEDKDLYWESLRAYDKLALKRENILLESRKLQNALSKLKKKFYPPILMDYEAIDNENLEQRLNALAQIANKDEILTSILKGFPSIQTLSDIQAKENGIDFKTANLEQAALLESLVRNGAKESVEAALSKSSRLKSSRLSQLNFVQSLLRTARERSVAMDAYPNVVLYEKYLQGFLSVDFEELFDEMGRLEDETYRALLPEEDARLVRSIDRYIGLLDSAYRIQMSTKEFELFKLNEPDFATAAYLAFVNRKLADLGYFDDLIPMQSVFEDAKSALAEFYSSVSRRDEAFARNAHRILSEEKQQVAVLIAGGYHTSNLKKLFAEKDYSYAVLAPIVTSETSQEKYEKVLLQPIRKKTVTVESVSGESASDDAPLSALEEDIQNLKRRADGIRAEAMAENGARLAEVIGAIPENPDSAEAALTLMRGAPALASGARLANERDGLVKDASEPGAGSLYLRAMQYLRLGWTAVLRLIRLRAPRSENDEERVNPPPVKAEPAKLTRKKAPQGDGSGRLAQDFSKHAEEYYESHKAYFDALEPFDTFNAFRDWYIAHGAEIVSQYRERHLGASYLVVVLVAVGKIEKKLETMFQHKASALDYALDSSTIRSAPVMETFEDFLGWFRANREQITAKNDPAKVLAAATVIDVLSQSEDVYGRRKIDSTHNEDFQFKAGAFDRALNDKEKITEEIERIFRTPSSDYESELKRLRMEFDENKLPNLLSKTEVRPLSEKYRNLILGFAYEEYGKEVIRGLTSGAVLADGPDHDSFIRFFNDHPGIIGVFGKLQQMKDEGEIAGYGITGSFTRGYYRLGESKDLDLAVMLKGLRPPTSVNEAIEKLQESEPHVQITLSAFGPSYFFDEKNGALRPDFVRNPGILASHIRNIPDRLSRFIYLTGKTITPELLWRLHEIVKAEGALTPETIEKQFPGWSSGARLAKEKTRSGTLTRRAFFWGLGGSLMAGAAVLNDRWVSRTEAESDRAFSSEEHDFRIVRVNEETIEQMRSGRLEFISTVNFFRAAGPGPEVIGLLKVDGEVIHEFNPNRRGNAAQRVLAVLDDNRLSLHEDLDGEGAALLAEKNRTVFQAGPVAVRDGRVNENLWDWYRGIFHGKVRVLGVDAEGNWRSREFYGWDRFGVLGRTADDFEAALRAWQRRHDIQQALFVDGGSAGVDEWSLQRPPFVLVAVPRASGARLAETVSPEEMKRIAGDAVLLRNRMAATYPEDLERWWPTEESTARLAGITQGDLRYLSQGGEVVAFVSTKYPHLVFKLRKVISAEAEYARRMAWKMEAMRRYAGIALEKSSKTVDGWELMDLPGIAPTVFTEEGVIVQEKAEPTEGDQSILSPWMTDERKVLIRKIATIGGEYWDFKPTNEGVIDGETVLLDVGGVLLSEYVERITRLAERQERIPTILTVNSGDKFGRDSARIIADRIRSLQSMLKRDVNIIFATGKTQVAMLRALAREPGIDWKRVQAFHLAEYKGLAVTHPFSSAYFLRKNLFSRIPKTRAIPRENVHFINGESEDPLLYLKKLHNSGGADMAFLGVDPHGEIGFNEPFTAFDSRMGETALPEGKTNGDASTPQEVIRMGLADIMEAQEIILLADNASKKRALFSAIYGPTREDVPASILRKHPHATFILSEDAVPDNLSEAELEEVRNVARRYFGEELEMRGAEIETAATPQQIIDILIGTLKAAYGKARENYMKKDGKKVILDEMEMEKMLEMASREAAAVRDWSLAGTEHRIIALEEAYTEALDEISLFEDEGDRVATSRMLARYTKALSGLKNLPPEDELKKDPKKTLERKKGILNDAILEILNLKEPEDRGFAFMMIIRVTDPEEDKGVMDWIGPIIEEHLVDLYVDALRALNWMVDQKINTRFRRNHDIAFALRVRDRINKEILETHGASPEGARPSEGGPSASGGRLATSNGASPSENEDVERLEQRIRRRAERNYRSEPDSGKKVEEVMRRLAEAKRFYDKTEFKSANKGLRLYREALLNARFQLEWRQDMDQVRTALYLPARRRVRTRKVEQLVREQTKDIPYVMEIFSQELAVLSVSREGNFEEDTRSLANYMNLILKLSRIPGTHGMETRLLHLLMSAKLADFILYAEEKGFTGLEGMDVEDPSLKEMLLVYSSLADKAHLGLVADTINSHVYRRLDPARYFSIIGQKVRLLAPALENDKKAELLEAVNQLERERASERLSGNTKNMNRLINRLTDLSWEVTERIENGFDVQALAGYLKERGADGATVMFRVKSDASVFEKIDIRQEYRSIRDLHDLTGLMITTSWSGIGIAINALEDFFRDRMQMSGAPDFKSKEEVHVDFSGNLLGQPKAENTALETIVMTESRYRDYRYGTVEKKSAYLTIKAHSQYRSERRTKALRVKANNGDEERVMPRFRPAENLEEVYSSIEKRRYMLIQVRDGKSRVLARRVLELSDDATVGDLLFVLDLSPDYIFYSEGRKALGATDLRTPLKALAMQLPNGENQYLYVVKHQGKGSLEKWVREVGRQKADPKKKKVLDPDALRMASSILKYSEILSRAASPEKGFVEGLLHEVVEVERRKESNGLYSRNRDGSYQVVREEKRIEDLLDELDVYSKDAGFTGRDMLFRAIHQGWVERQDFLTQFENYASSRHQTLPNMNRSSGARLAEAPLNELYSMAGAIFTQRNQGIEGTLPEFVMSMPAAHERVFYKLLAAVEEFSESAGMDFSPEDKQLIRKAYLLAFAAHYYFPKKPSNKYRRIRGLNVLYIEHPVGVARSLIEDFGPLTRDTKAQVDAVAVAAALLHDILEDTKLSDIDAPELMLLLDVSNQEHIQVWNMVRDLSIRERETKAQYYERLVSSINDDPSRDAGRYFHKILIKLSDKLDSTVRDSDTVEAHPEILSLRTAREMLEFLETRRHFTKHFVNYVYRTGFSSMREASLYWYRRFHETELVQRERIAKKPFGPALLKRYPRRLAAVRVKRLPDIEGDSNSSVWKSRGFLGSAAFVVQDVSRMTEDSRSAFLAKDWQDVWVMARGAYPPVMAHDWLASPKNLEDRVLRDPVRIHAVVLFEKMADGSLVPGGVYLYHPAYQNLEVITVSESLRGTGATHVLLEDFRARFGPRSHFVNMATLPITPDIPPSNASLGYFSVPIYGGLLEESLHVGATVREDIPSGARLADDSPSEAMRERVRSLSRSVAFWRDHNAGGALRRTLARIEKDLAQWTSSSGSFGENLNKVSKHLAALGRITNPVSPSGRKTMTSPNITANHTAVQKLLSDMGRFLRETDTIAKKRIHDQALLDEWTKNQSELKDVYNELGDMLDRDEQTYQMRRFMGLGSRRDSLLARQDDIKKELGRLGMTPPTNGEQGARLAGTPALSLDPWTDILSAKEIEEEVRREVRSLDRINEIAFRLERTFGLDRWTGEDPASHIRKRNWASYLSSLGFPAATMKEASESLLLTRVTAVLRQRLMARMGALPGPVTAQTRVIDGSLLWAAIPWNGRRIELIRSSKEDNFTLWLDGVRIDGRLNDQNQTVPEKEFEFYGTGFVLQENGDFLNVEALFILPEYQKLGIGRAISRWAAAYARNRGFKRLGVDTGQNPNALRALAHVLEPDSITLERWERSAAHTRGGWVPVAWDPDLLESGKIYRMSGVPYSDPPTVGARLADAETEKAGFAIDSWTPSALRTLFKKIIRDKFADILSSQEKVTVRISYEKGLDEKTLQMLRRKKAGNVSDYFRYQDSEGKTRYLFPVPSESEVLDPQAQYMLAYLREVGHPHKGLTGIWEERPSQSAFRMIAAIYYHTRQMLYIRSLVMSAPEQVYSIRAYSNGKLLFSAQARVSKNSDDTRLIEVLSPAGIWEPVYETPKDRPIDKKAREEAHILGTERLVLGKFAEYLRGIDSIVEDMKEFSKLSPKAANPRAKKAREVLEGISTRLALAPEKLSEMTEDLARVLLSQRKQIRADLDLAAKAMGEGQYRETSVYLNNAASNLRSEIQRMLDIVDRHENLKSAVMSERARLSADPARQGARLAGELVGSAEYSPQEIEELLTVSQNRWSSPAKGQMLTMIVKKIGPVLSRIADRIDMGFPERTDATITRYHANSVLQNVFRYATENAIDAYLQQRDSGRAETSLKMDFYYESDGENMTVRFLANGVSLAEAENSAEKRLHRRLGGRNLGLKGIDGVSKSVGGRTRLADRMSTVGDKDGSVFELILDKRTLAALYETDASGARLADDPAALIGEDFLGWEVVSIRPGEHGGFIYRARLVSPELSKDILIHDFIKKYPEFMGEFGFYLFERDGVTEIEWPDNKELEAILQDKHPQMGIRLLKGREADGPYVASFRESGIPVSREFHAYTYLHDILSHFPAFAVLFSNQKTSDYLGYVFNPSEPMSKEETRRVSGQIEAMSAQLVAAVLSPNFVKGAFLQTYLKDVFGVSDKHPSLAGAEEDVLRMLEGYRQGARLADRDSDDRILAAIAALEPLDDAITQQMIADKAGVVRMTVTRRMQANQMVDKAVTRATGLNATDVKILRALYEMRENGIKRASGGEIAKNAGIDRTMLYSKGRDPDVRNDIDDMIYGARLADGKVSVVDVTAGQPIEFTKDPIVLVAEDLALYQNLYPYMLKRLGMDLQVVRARTLEEARYAYGLAKATGLMKFIVTDGLYPATREAFDAWKANGKEEMLKRDIINFPSEWFSSGELFLRDIAGAVPTAFISAEIRPAQVAGIEVAYLKKPKDGVDDPYEFRERFLNLASKALKPEEPAGARLAEKTGVSSQVSVVREEQSEGPIRFAEFYGARLSAVFLVPVGEGVFPMLQPGGIVPFSAAQVNEMSRGARLAEADRQTAPAVQSLASGEITEQLDLEARQIRVFDGAVAALGLASDSLEGVIGVDMAKFNPESLPILKIAVSEIGRKYPKVQFYFKGSTELPGVSQEAWQGAGGKRIFVSDSALPDAGYVMVERAPEGQAHAARPILHYAVYLLGLRSTKDAQGTLVPDGVLSGVSQLAGNPSDTRLTGQHIVGFAQGIRTPELLAVANAYMARAMKWVDASIQDYLTRLQAVGRSA